MAQTGGGDGRDARGGVQGQETPGSRAGGPKGPSALLSCSSPRKPTEDPAPRSWLWLPQTRGAANSRKGRCGRPVSWPQTSATPPTPRSQMPSAPGLRSRDGETLEGIGTHPRATPTRQERFAVLDGRRKSAAGMRRWRPSSGGVRSPGCGVPAPPRAQLPPKCLCGKTC